MTGSLYFVQEDHCGPIKIGFTKGMVFSRLHSMQVGNPRRLQLLAEISPATAADEAAWHKEFAELRFVGEWFHPTAGLLSAIIERAKPPHQYAAAAPGTMKALAIKDKGRCGWVSPRARKHIADKQREATP